MPIYEYQCQSCGHLFEELQSMSEAPLVKCPSCGKDELKKLIGSGAGLIFKGSGFYQTDYKDSAGKLGKSKSSSDKKTETKSTSDESKSEQKQESKSDTKTENKTESKSESKSESKTESKPAKKSK